MFGKRTNVFNKHDWCKKNCSPELFEETIQELLQEGETKKEFVTKLMKQYNFNHCDNFNQRFDNYHKIIISEIN